MFETNSQGFSSISDTESHEHSRDKPCNNNEKLPVIFHIEWKWSVYHCQMTPSAYPDEKEVVIDDGVLFRVTDKYECMTDCCDGYTLIRLKDHM